MRSTYLLRRALPGLPFALLLFGCGEDPGPAPVISVRDSAGVRIVETLSLPDAGGRGWSVFERPLVSVGPDRLSGGNRMSRISGGSVLADGTIVAAPRGSGEVLFFGRRGEARGKLVLPARRDGSPASVTFLAARASGSLVLFDELGRRLILLPYGGGPVASREIRGDGTALMAPVGLLEEGGVVFMEPLREDVEEGTVGLSRRRTRLFTVGWSGEVGEVVGECPGPEIWRSVVDGNVVGRALPFGKETLVTAGGDRLFLSLGGSYQIGVLDGGGRPVASIRLAREPLPVRESDTVALIQGLLDRIAASPAARSSLREAYRALPIPARMPSIRSLAVDRLGFLWAEDYRRPGDTIPVWTVFDPEGRGVASLSLPAGLEPLEIGEDYILARHTSSGGEESVQLYRLHRR